MPPKQYLKMSAKPDGALLWLEIGYKNPKENKIIGPYINADADNANTERDIVRKELKRLCDEWTDPKVSDEHYNWLSDDTAFGIDKLDMTLFYSTSKQVFFSVKERLEINKAIEAEIKSMSGSTTRKLYTVRERWLAYDPNHRMPFQKEWPTQPPKDPNDPNEVLQEVPLEDFLKKWLTDTGINIPFSNEVPFHTFGTIYDAVEEAKKRTRKEFGKPGTAYLYARPFEIVRGEMVLVLIDADRLYRMVTVTEIEVSKEERKAIAMK